MKELDEGMQILLHHAYMYEHKGEMRMDNLQFFEKKCKPRQCQHRRRDYDEFICGQLFTQHSFKCRDCKQRITLSA